ncbi:MAG: PQQ-binding-like beta-propeller repeat protein, partial [Micromonosporaceae bacterium]|nr:PQQ-binding-like beta-propeller repeat protein [Micromonosporaceae bacterium]
VGFEGTAYPAEIQDGRAYLAAESDGELSLTAVSLDGGEVLWDKRLSADAWEDGITAHQKFVVAVEEHDDSSRTLHVFAPSGKKLLKRKLPYGAWHMVHEDRLIVGDPEQDTLVWIDVNGNKQAGETEYTESLYPVDTWAAESGSAAHLEGYRFESPEPDQRMVAINDLGSMRVLDATDGKALRTATLKDMAGDHLVRGYAGRLLVIGQAEDTEGYQVYAYDLAKPGSPRRLHADTTKDRTVERATPCGEELLCLVDSDGHLTPVDIADGGSLWRKKVGDSDDVGAVNAMGDRIMVAHNRGDTAYTSFFDHSGGVRRVKGAAAPVDATTALLFPPERAPISGETVNPSTSTYSVPLVGIGAVSGERTDIGSVDARLDTCGWNHAYIACAGESTFSIHRFRDV